MRQQGTTLLELLFVLTLSTLLMYLIFSFYLIAKRNSSTMRVLNQIQLTAETISTFLRHDLKRAGYVGCARYHLEQPMFSFRENEITLRFAEFPRTQVINAEKDIIYAEKKVKPEEQLLISDCQNAELITVVKVEMNSTFRINKPLKYHYHPTAQISRFFTIRYFYKNSTLYRQTDSNPPNAIATQLVNFHVSQLNHVLTISFLITQQGIQKPFYLLTTIPTS